MKLITTEFGQVLQFLTMEEVRPIFPNNQIYAPDFYQRAIERYRFAVGPEDIMESLEKGAKFREGEITIGDMQIVIGELGVYNDGIFVSTRDTRTSDLVVDDFLKWMILEFKLRRPSQIPPKQYTSAVVVEFSPEIDQAFSIFNATLERFGSAVNQLTGMKFPVHLNRLSFAMDPTDTNKPTNSCEFVLERRRGHPFSQNRWFSGASLPTQKHLELLEALETDYRK